MCSLECKCKNGDPGDGGVNVNNYGYCESYCHEFGGNYYCGASEHYERGIYVDCRGCITGMNLTKIYIEFPFDDVIIHISQNRI